MSSSRMGCSRKRNEHRTRSVNLVVSRIAAGNGIGIGAVFSKWRRGCAGVCREEGVRVPVTSLVISYWRNGRKGREGERTANELGVVSHKRDVPISEPNVMNASKTESRSCTGARQRTLSIE
jgi:ribosomal protein L34E